MKKSLGKIAVVIVCLLAIIIAVNPMLLGVLLVIFGRYDVPRVNSPLLEAHERAIYSFVESEGFGISRFSPAKFWNEISVSFEGREYRVENVRLIGLTPEHGDRIFTGQFPPRKNELEDSDSRALNEEELRAVNRLRNSPAGEATMPVEEPKELRVFLPLPATKSCLKCHSINEGDILGVFDYSLLEYER